MIVRDAREQILRIDVCIVERIPFEKLPAALLKKMGIVSVFVAAEWSSVFVVFRCFVKFSNGIWRKRENREENVMFEENGDRFSFCCSWVKPCFCCFSAFREFYQWNLMKERKLWRKCDVRRKCESFQFLLWLIEVPFCGSSAFCEF